MKIYVRRRHIEKGKLSARRCPIALAFKEAMRRSCWVGFGDIDGVILPRSAQRFIARFDSGKPVKPFAFTIRA